MLYSFFPTKMLGVALPFGFATPTFIIEPVLFGPNWCFCYAALFCNAPLRSSLFTISIAMSAFQWRAELLDSPGQLTPRTAFAPLQRQ